MRGCFTSQDPLCADVFRIATIFQRFTQITCGIALDRHNQRGRVLEQTSNVLYSGLMVGLQIALEIVDCTGSTFSCVHEPLPASLFLHISTTVSPPKHNHYKAIGPPETSDFSLLEMSAILLAFSRCSLNFNCTLHPILLCLQ